MRKSAFMFLIASLVVAQPASSALSQHIVDYRIKARLVPAEKAVIAEETVTWLNNSDLPVSELQFHLYLNAFKNNRSTFMKESGGVHRGFGLRQDDWGYIQVKDIKIKDGLHLNGSLQYIHPDDDNQEDRTVMKVELPEPVLPQEKITLEIEFASRLPRVFARSGYAGDFYMVAQWFPKIGVWEDGRWNCHQYHSHSEFFADFGVYEVAITVPEDYLVGATGERVREEKGDDGTVTYTYYQEDVHDFAWTACPDFLEFREPFRLNDPPVKTEITLMIHKSHRSKKDRYLQALRNGITFYSQNYGPYPYTTITLVDPPLKGMGAAGMEYPTLFTGATFFILPKGIRLTEDVTIHEFGHGFWYGIVASNEFEEPWLDEGINSYSEVKAMNAYYGKDSSLIDFLGVKISDTANQRLSVVGSSELDPILRRSWEFFNGGSYSVNSYAKPAITLLTLERYLGEETMARIMRQYYESWKFRHPRTQDFINVAQAVSGQDLGWFFNQFFRSPGKLDYAVGVLSSREIQGPEGMFEGEYLSSRKKDSGKKNEERLYRNEVPVVRKGELIFPVEIRVVFEDGEVINETWNGKDRWIKFVYEKPSRLDYVEIDPDRKILLDINFINNSRCLKPERRFSIKSALGWMLNFQNLISWVSF
jgi:hypothetical protein